MTHLKKTKPPKKIQTFRISQELLHEINTLVRERKQEFKNQAAVIIALLELGLWEEYDRQSSYTARASAPAGITLTNYSPTIAHSPASFLLPQANFAESEPQQLSVRLPIDLLGRIELLAKQRRAEIHHTSKKVTLSPTILDLIKLGVEKLEQHPTVPVANLILAIERRSKT